MPTDIDASVNGSPKQGSLLAWSAVTLLCALYVMSFVDRMILALLVQPITQDLGVSDTEVGVLIGIGFALVYVLIGLPIAHIVDGGARRKVLIAGVVLWSLATIASAFSENFWHLAIARLGVAIGEAALTPVAIAVIADMFPKERRELPTSIYMAVGVLMGSGAFILGGFAVDAAEYVSPMISMDVWRTTLILVGLPGLLLALFAVFLIGPAKQQGASAKTVVSAEEALAYLRGDGLFFLLLFICIGFVSMLAMGLVSWAPTMLIREFGFEVSEAGFAFGSVGMPAAVLGTVLAPIVAKSLSGRFGHSSTPLVIGACSLIGSTLLVLGLASGSTLFLLIGVAGMMLFLSGAIVMPAIVIQILSPPPLRARLMAMNLLCLGLIGQGMGPVIVARIGEVRGGEGGLSFGLMITAMLSATLAISFAWLMHRRLNAPETQRSLAAASEAPSV